MTKKRQKNSKEFSSNLPKFGQRAAKIKVIGIGGAGGNAVSRMARAKIKGVELIAVNADLQDLKKARAHQKVPIGQKVTGGLGTGMNPALGRKAAKEDKEKLAQLFKGAEMVFLTAGLGGGCGTGASPVLADLAREQGILTLAVITLPFSFEGRSRQIIAKKGLRELADKVDTLIRIENDKILNLAGEDLSLATAFERCDEVLKQAVQGITDLIFLPGIINVDLADVKAIMKNSGTALFGIGKARGAKRAEQAAKAALSSPLLARSCEGAKGVLFNVSGSGDISLAEIEEIAKIITQEVSPQAKVIFGAIQDEKLKKGEIKVTVIATGF